MISLHCLCKCSDDTTASDARVAQYHMEVTNWYLYESCYLAKNRLETHASCKDGNPPILIVSGVSNTVLHIEYEALRFSMPGSPLGHGT